MSTSGGLAFNPAAPVFTGGQASPIRAVGASATTTLADSTLTVNSLAAAFTITLVANPPTGFEQTVKKTDASTNAVTVQGSGGVTVDGQASVSLAAQNDAVTVQYTGTAWVALSQIDASIL